MSTDRDFGTRRRPPSHFSVCRLALLCCRACLIFFLLPPALSAPVTAPAVVLGLIAVVPVTLCACASLHTGLYLTDLTFCREGNPSYRPSPLAPNKKLLNFNKYHKLARIVQDLQRFQVPLNLKDVPEAQEYIHFCLEKAKDHGDLDDLYRRR